MEKFLCETCGSTYFRVEGNVSYCTECQTELIHGPATIIAKSKPPTNTEDKSATKAKEEPTTNAKDELNKKKPEKVFKMNPKVICWECFNYVMVGLVEELIKLGAHANFKRTVQILWFKYLKTIHVLHADEISKMVKAFNCVKDSAIEYNRCKSNHCKVCSDYVRSSECSNEDPLMKKEQLPNKNGGSVIAENTLPKTTKRTKRNVDRQNNNNNDEEISFRKITHTCARADIYHPNILTRVKVFGILYLALLINNDKIQLGDMFRFILEGHLSYNEVDHFFPKTVDSKLKFATTPHLFSIYSLRVTASRMAGFIDVQDFIPIQNLTALCERYCQELNLPEQVTEFTTQLIQKTSPKMEITPMNKIIPNYEGRAMSFILFSLKLIFDFDNIKDNSTSNLLNPKKHKIVKIMFNLKHWLLFLEYRKLVLSQALCPGQFVTHNIEIFTNFIESYYYQKEEIDPKLSLQKQVLDNFLSILREKKSGFTFPPTFTPFKYYLERVVMSKQIQRSRLKLDILNQDFSQAHVDLSFNSTQFCTVLNQLNEEFKTKSISNVEGFPNSDDSPVPIISDNDLNTKKYEPNQEDPVIDAPKSTLKKPSKVYLKRKAEKLKNHKLRNGKKCNCNLDQLENICKDFKKKSEATFSVLEPDPFNLTKSEYFNLFPYHFQLVFDECRRIIEQPFKSILEEYTKLDIHISYNMDNTWEDLRSCPLNTMLPKSNNFW